MHHSFLIIVKKKLYDMKILFLSAILLFINFSRHPAKQNAIPINKTDVLRCVGANPCRACSNCSSCGWCKAGGTCGVCINKKKTDTIQSLKSMPAKQSAISGQCKAITKKGTRCSRTAKPSGYCWQHGG